MSDSLSNLVLTGDRRHLPQSEVTAGEHGIPTRNNAMLYILIAERDDSLTLIKALESPDAHLRVLGMYGTAITRHFRTELTHHAQAIVRAMRARFSHAATDPQGPWFAIEYAEAMQALGNWNIKTGKQVGLRDINLRDLVHVEGIGPGTVTGFQGSRIEVRHDRFANALRGTLAPASMVTLIKAAKK
jgi:hypothetical protein